MDSASARARLIKASVGPFLLFGLCDGGLGSSLGTEGILLSTLDVCHD